MLAAFAQAQVRPAYTLFDGTGKKLTEKQMVRIVSDGEVILFGELHNNPIAHWLEMVVMRELAAKGPLVVGTEMVEADDQRAVDRYLRNEVDAEGLDTLASLWPNHKTDYAPLLEFAKEKGIPVVASNVPRRYARAVSKGGFEALDTVPLNERGWIAPLPIAFDPELPGYVKMLTMMGDHGGPNTVKAQALKDATMAHFIAANTKPGGRFLHFNGSYHSDFHEAIGWYLRRARPELKQVTIATVSQEDLGALSKEHIDKADIIICVDALMPSSY
ncbi:MAG: ChaN family lipoprotein [Flavobacteriales bacterium]|nr:ChaN family lipoprotein [Flavobacteriales bacterium]